ncbi:18099_t:CDS:2, partial [Entrophospora sp. SA101]
MYKVSLVTDFLLLASFQDRKTVISCFQLFKEGIKKNQQREKTKATTQAASLEYLNIFRKTMGTEVGRLYDSFAWIIYTCYNPVNKKIKSLVIFKLREHKKAHISVSSQKSLEGVSNIISDGNNEISEGYDIQKGIKYAIENSQDIGLLEYDEPLLSSIIDVSDPPHWLEKSFTDEIWNVIADPS